jgi:hypothetical protein
MGALSDRQSERIEFLSDTVELQRFFDLSKTGVCCRHTGLLQKDEVVSVRINDLVLSAKVAWCTPRTDGFRVGLQFVKLTPDQAKALDDLVERYSRGVPVKVDLVGQNAGKTK